MDKRLDLLEFETMLLGRHMHMINPHGPGASEERLDRSAYVLLSRIRVQGPMSIGELREAFGLDASTLNRQTAAMLRAGVVQRMADPGGGIARKFAITAEGERRLEAHRAENLEGLEKIMVDWAADDVAEFAAYLSRFNRDIERLDGRPWPRG